MKYPNLELLEYRFQEVLMTEHDSNKRFIPDCDAYVFPQTWPNTGGGLARRGYCYGDAMTRQYTTVMINFHDDAAMVAFGNTPAYFVKPLNVAFNDDLNRMRMESVDRTERYDNTCVRNLYG